MTAAVGAPPAGLAHARYAERVAALASHELVPAVLPGGDAAGWRRRFGRLDPGADPYATLVFERAGDRPQVVRVEAYEIPPVVGEPHVLAHGAAGWLRVAALPHDPRLPALAGLLEGPEPGTVIRYRPYSRCTVRFGRPPHARFAKVFCDGQGPRVHLEAMAVWDSACRGELGFEVARPARLDERTGVVWQEEVTGRPAAAGLVGTGGQDLAERIGLAAGTLSRSSVRPLREHGPGIQLARSARVGLRLSAMLPELAGPVERLLGLLRALHAGAPQRRLRPTHGDLTPDQWLERDKDVGLLDFEELVLAEPERDAGLFVAGLAAGDGGRGRMHAEPLAGAFLAGFASSAGTLCHDLVRAYAGHKLLRKAHLAACSLDPGGPGRAAARIDTALRWLQEERP